MKWLRGKGNITNIQRKLACIFITLLFSTSLAVNALEKRALDVAIIMDTSSSMKKNDPGRLRIEAAKLFVALLDRKDRVALISFSGRAYPITRFLSLNERKNEQKILKSIEQLVSNGKYTNLHDALLRGYELLTQQTNSHNAKHIILLSDGKMDLGNEERNLRLLEKTLSEITPKLAEANIKVHTLALTKQSYVPLLKLTAQDTDGQFILLDSPEGIHQVFERLFERTKRPEMIPLSEESFVLDKAVNELTIVASKLKPDSTIEIASPDGNDFTLANHTANVKWFSAKQFDLITIKKPAKGYWLVKYSEGGNKVYILSDFKLEASTTKRKAEPGSPLQIQAYLSKKSKKINRRSLLRTTEFKAKVTSPSGAVIENLLADDGSEIGSERGDGIYGISYVFDLEGTYKVEVTAIGQTFDRKKTLFIDVQSIAPLQPFAKAKEDKARELKRENERVAEAARKHEKELEAAKLVEEEPPAPEVNNITESHPSLASDEPLNTSQKEPPISHETNETSENLHADMSGEEEHSEDGFNLGSILTAVFMFIAFIGVLGGAPYYYFVYLPKKKAKKGEKSDTSSTTKISEKSSKKEEFEHLPEGTQGVDLEESISDALSDLELDEDLEKDLSSILETEMDKFK